VQAARPRQSTVLIGQNHRIDVQAFHSVKLYVLSHLLKSWPPGKKPDLNKSKSS
jgi:hypothetical protein